MRQATGAAARRAPIPADPAAYILRLRAPRPWYELQKRPWLNPRQYEWSKRWLDVVLCVMALPFVMLVLALCCLAIRIESPGAAMFRQKRTARGGRRFEMYKLRTMVKDAEALKASLMHLNELTYPDFKITNDPRITKVGRFLRKTSLDELPQIFNILRGDMSLVGPRPTSFSANTYSLWHTARLDMTPGLTGLWQVSGRSKLDFDDRLKLDIAYRRNQCFWLDIKILARTVGAVASGKGAE
jgi:lipopolysaccharide/colanic/teichoic acid biosynthesis glycosyltransferase